jgi:hypothetical protein
MSDFCTGTGRVMLPGFQETFSGGAPCVLFLFVGWALDTPWKYALGVIGAFAMGVCNDALLFSRRWMTQKATTMSRAWMALPGLVYGVHMVLAYWMMLLVMTYEYVLFSALILGLVTGHLIFSIYLPLKFDSAAASASEYTEHADDKKILPFGGSRPSGSTPCCGGAEISRY